MGEVRRDPLSGRLVIVAADRADRPTDLHRPQPPSEATASCPFCPGNEHETTPARLVDEAGGRWLLRVVGNRYPIVHPGPGGNPPSDWRDVTPALGEHEVVIFTPDHATTWADLDDAACDRFARALAARLDAHAADQRLAHAVALVNHGRDAGASLAHPHAQLVATAFVPPVLVDELAGFDHHVARTGACLLCEVVTVERATGELMVADRDGLIALCPRWSGFPMEVLVLPAAHRESPSALELVAAVRLVRELLRALRAARGEVPYNVVVHLAPFTQGAGRWFHWHVHLWPKLVAFAGFELGAGVLVNPVRPSAAAAAYRDFTGA